VQLAIVHYHLNRGGVMQVIANHLRSLDAALAAQDGSPWRVGVLYGGRAEGWPAELENQLAHLQLELIEIPGLDYDGQQMASPEELAARIDRALRASGGSPAATILHIHNHSLGKNLALPEALADLAQQGYRELLQIHDFAEDYRPHLYRRLLSELGKSDPARLSAVLYPQAPQVHYAVLNGRDFKLLTKAGMPRAQLHLLPNPVASPGALPEHDEARAKLERRFGVPRDARWLLYPVRGIRRKNVGEAILWAALLEQPAMVGVTLPPLNPQELATYQHWKELVNELGLPFISEVGAADGLSFVENLSAADGLLTTSLAEGFGMVFLESWLVGRHLVGRDLPEITADFVARGVRLDSLQAHFFVPTEWIGGDDAFAGMLAGSFAEVLESYGLERIDEQTLADQARELTAGGHVDFGYLSQDTQSRAIRHVAADTQSARATLAELNPQIALLLAGPPQDTAQMIEHNRRVVSEHYNLAACGQRLLDLYGHLARSESAPSTTSLAHGDAILRELVSIRRYCPMRV